MVVSGPSGVGKGTVVRGVKRNRPGLALSVSATTRPRREGERDGADYHFLDDDAFDRLVDEGGLLEWASFAGHRYGTPADAVADALASGRTVILEIDVQGARQVRERMPDALLVFLTPPSLGELEQRLQARGTETADGIAARLALAASELDAAEEFDHVVVNDDLESAVDEVLRILDG